MCQFGLDDLYLLPFNSPNNHLGRLFIFLLIKKKDIRERKGEGREGGRETETHTKREKETLM